MVVGSGKGRTYSTAPGEAEALELAAKLRADLDAGVLDEPEGTPTKVCDVLDRFMRTKEHDDKVRTSTRETYGFWSKAIKSGMGSVSLRLLDRRDVLRYVQDRLDVGRSPETVLDEVRLLRMALAFAVKRGWWRGDVSKLCGDLDLPEVQEKAVLLAEEVAPFLAALLDQRTVIACKLALFAGLRAGEVVTRQWRDLDLRRGLLHVGPKSLPRWSWRTKNGKSRFVPLNRDLVADLKAWRLKCGEPDADAWVVPCRDGERRRHVRTLNLQVQRACERAGVTVVSFHGLRHSCASLAIDAGVPLPTVSKILGHHSPEFTARLYVHATEQGLVVEADRLQRHVSGASRRSTRRCA